MNEETFTTLCMRHGVLVHTVSQGKQQEVYSAIPAVDETLLCDESAVLDELADPVLGHSSLSEMSMSDWHQFTEGGCGPSKGYNHIRDGLRY